MGYTRAMIKFVAFNAGYAVGWVIDFVVRAYQLIDYDRKNP